MIKISIVQMAPGKLLKRWDMKKITKYQLAVKTQQNKEARGDQS